MTTSRKFTIVFAVVSLGGLAGLIGWGEMLAPASRPQSATTPVAQPAAASVTQTQAAPKSVGPSKYDATWTKADEQHEKAEEDALLSAEGQVGSDQFSKFMTAKNAGATPGELCAILQVAHLAYAEAGATDEVKNTHDWQMEYKCRQ